MTQAEFNLWLEGYLEGACTPSVAKTVREKMKKIVKKGTSIEDLFKKHTEPKDSPLIPPYEPTKNPFDYRDFWVGDRTFPTYYLTTLTDGTTF